MADAWLVILALLGPCSGMALPDHAFDWIRKIANSSGSRYKLDPGIYYIDKQYQLPSWTEVVGSGSDPTFGTVIKAVSGPNATDGICGSSAVNRIGFILGDHTYVGGLHFAGNDSMRYLDNGLLCGGAPFETPGCADTGYFADAPNCSAVTGIGRGVCNATLEDVTIANLSVQSAVYLAPTPWGAKVSSNITINSLHVNGTWADGINIHGAHQNILVSNSKVHDTGDDAFAVWSVGIPGATNITFMNNSAARPWFRPGGSKSPIGWRNTSECFAVYGGDSVQVSDNSCAEGHLAITIFGNDKHVTYGGQFSNESVMTVTGNHGDYPPCYFGVEYHGKAICKSDRPSDRTAII